MSLAFMIDGRIVAPEHAQVSVLDRGFLYGDSVFETVRTYGGRAFALDAHLARLAQSAARVFIELPVALPQIAEEVRELLAHAGHPESYVRIMITRGTGQSLGLDPGLAVSPLRVIIVGPLDAPPARAYDEGISVITFRTQRPAEATEAAGAKVGNYLAAVLAMREARRVGASEALIVDAAGHVIEGASSNVFVWDGGALCTPPESAGILPGITRSHLLEVAETLGLPVELRPIAVEELGLAPEVFVSSSIRELLPVVQVNDRAVGTGKPGPVTRRLLSSFREKARASVGL